MIPALGGECNRVQVRISLSCLSEICLCRESEFRACGYAARKYKQKLRPVWASVAQFAFWIPHYRTHDPVEWDGLDANQQAVGKQYIFSNMCGPLSHRNIGKCATNFAQWSILSILGTKPLFCGAITGRWVFLGAIQMNTVGFTFHLGICSTVVLCNALRHVGLFVCLWRRRRIRQKLRELRLI